MARENVDTLNFDPCVRTDLKLDKQDQLKMAVTPDGTCSLY